MARNDGGEQTDGFDGWEDAEVPQPDAVPARLAELGLSVQLLRESIYEGQTAGDFCTPAHPVWYAGARVYGETNGGLRLRTAMNGWTFTDDSCIPRTISPDGAVVLTAVQGDAQTGLRHGPDAQTRRPRRSASIRIIKRNAQFVLAGVLPDDETDPLPEGTVLGPTWFLLYYRDGEKVRAELSLAMAVDDAGHLVRWSERLILPELDMLDGPHGGGLRTDDTPPEVDVPVIARSG